MLTATAIKKTKPREKQFKLTDGRGMYLLVTPKGGKLWRLDYRFGGKRKTLALGCYPEIGLLDAREAREAAREKIARGRDPMAERAKTKAERSPAAPVGGKVWEDALGPYKQKRRMAGLSAHTLTQTNRMATILEPALTGVPLDEINAAHVRPVIEDLQKAGKHETVKRVVQMFAGVMGMAVAWDMTDNNPAA